MSKSLRKQRKSFNEINITPLTDIFLVLLIIMMVVAPMLDQQGLKLSVPAEQEVKDPKESKIVNIDVSAKGEYSIDNQPITADALVSRIQEASKTKKDGLLILTSGDASHGAVVKVMDAARNAGVNSISVIEK